MMSTATQATNDGESTSVRALAPFHQGFDVHGVRIAVAAPEQELLDRMVAALPSGLPMREPEPTDPWFALVQAEENVWSFSGSVGHSANFADLELVLAMIDSALRRYIADNAKDDLFIHAGAVAFQGRAIVIPGDSFSGKTTLVAELVRAGAEYYSDEYAILDGQGLLHPFARPLSIRGFPPRERDRSSVESLGGRVGVDPVPLGLIAATAYRPGASFRPQRRSAGQGVLALLAHSAGAHERPGALAAVRQAASTALVVEGERGEAAAAAQALLEIASEADWTRAGTRR